MYNERSIEKVLTTLYINNDLIISNEYPLRLDDFVDKKYKAIYTALYNLYSLGNNHIDINDIVSYFKEQQGMYEKFITDGGMDVLYTICGGTASSNFDYDYTTIKKYSLLRDLVKNGIDIQDIYNKEQDPVSFEKQLAQFNAMGLDDIFKKVEVKLSALELKYQNFMEKTCISASDNIEELYKELQNVPEVGLPLEGDIYNTVTRGARLKKVYMDSRSSGAGKSRNMLGNACRLAIPVRYNTELEEWENTGANCKVLYITTELEHSELQTMILAYIAGVNEDSILNNKCSQAEKERIELAIQYLKVNDNIMIELISNPSIPIVESVIKKHAIQDEVQYVFYDYIHISSGLTEGRDKQTRDDVLLLLLCDTLKRLANELDIFVYTASQLSGDYEDKEVKNETLLRGAKSLADKVDCASITLRVSPSEQELGKALALKLGTYEPNFVTDVYKNRRGKWTGIRIWRYIDLGMCRTVDCFITNRRNEPIDFNNTNVQIKQAGKVGGFIVKE